MKRGRLLYSLAALFMFITGPLGADDTSQRLESILLDTFDNEDSHSWLESGIEKKEERYWLATGSKFATKEVVKDDTGAPVLDNGKKVTKQYPIGVFAADTWPAAVYDTNPEKLPLKAFGVHSKFDRMGYNYIEIYPATKTKDKDGKDAYEPMEMRLPGIVKMIDLWVWGSMFKYYMEIHLRDYRGVPHILQLGSLWFQGWKNLKVDVPTGIPQTQAYLPNYKGLTLTKIVIRTDPTERVADYYVYLDNLKILTDMQQSPFDGRDLIKPDIVKKIWADKR